MERSGLIILLSAAYICGIPFSLHDQSGTTEVCNCDSVDFWLPCRRRGSSLKLPSYEELNTSASEKSLDFDKKAGRYLRLRLQRDCKHWLNKDEALNGDVSFKNESTEDGSIEVWLKDGIKCLSLWMKCRESQKSICVGIDVLAKDFSQSTKRKLLMVVPDEKEEKVSYGRYGIIMSAFVLCLMVILLVLCGTSSTNNAEVYTGEANVEIISSAKVQSMHRKGISTEIENEEEEEPAAKDVDHTDGVEPPRSSTSDSSTVVVHDKVSVAVTDNDAHKDTNDSRDGQVFGKEKDPEKGNKNKKEKEKKSSVKAEKKKKEEDTTKEKIKKEKDSLKQKNMKEKGSGKEKNREKGFEKEDRNKEGEREAHTSLAERAEQKGFPKLRLSIKANAKKPKKKAKTKSLSDVSPSQSPSTNDRQSLVHRELPQRPSQDSTGGLPETDDNYAEPFDRKFCPEVMPNKVDIDGDGDYEAVTNQMKGRTMVSARNEDLTSCRNSSASGRQVSVNETKDDDIFYSVPEKKKMQGTGESSNVQEETLDNISDTYEVVEESTKRTRPQPKQVPEADLYEVVDSSNKLDAYEEPKIRRERSASDIVTGSPSTMTGTGHKSKSLSRSMAPPLPPLPGLPRAFQGGNEGHVSGESDAELIEPYTQTTKKGDFIFQETNTSIIPNSMKANSRDHSPASPEELELLYTKVDKEKQKIDRLKAKRESDVELNDGKKEEDGGSANGTNAAMATNTTIGAIANTAVVANDNHEYESISTLKRKSATLIEGEDLYDEVIDDNTAPSKTTS